MAVIGDFSNITGARRRRRRGGGFPSRSWLANFFEQGGPTGGRRLAGGSRGELGPGGVETPRASANRGWTYTPGQGWTFAPSSIAYARFREQPGLVPAALGAYGGGGGAGGGGAGGGGGYEAIGPPNARSGDRRVGAGNTGGYQAIGPPRRREEFPGQGEQGPPGNQGLAERFGLPLDPFFEAERRGLDDQLAAALSRIAALRPQIQSGADVGLARLGTQEGLQRRSLGEQMAERGLYDSGVRTGSERELADVFGRSRQDIAFNLAQQLSGLAGEESGAHLGYDQGLLEALMALAQRQAANPSLAVPGEGGQQQKRRRRRRRR